MVSPLAPSLSSTNLPIDTFRRIFVSLGQSRAAFALCRCLVAVDGTFLKGRFQQALLLAVGIDAAGHNIMLAWAVVESENSSSWEWFFRHLRRAIPLLGDEPCVVISDRDKGLIEGVKTLGPWVAAAHCCFHLLQNFKKAGHSAMQHWFWRVARVRTPQQFTDRLAQLEAAKPPAAEWLRRLEEEKWAFAYFPLPRFGHDTSNVVESVNKVLKEDRELPIIALLDALWHRVMDQAAERHADATALLTRGKQFTPFCAKLVNERRKLAQSYTVQLSSEQAGVGRVTESTLVNPVFVVDLGAGRCSCREWEDTLVPCSHAMCLIFKLHGSLELYLPPLLSTKTWQSTYSAPLPPIDIDGLRPSTVAGQHCVQPQVSGRRGRPRKERLRPGEARTRGLGAGDFGALAVGEQELRNPYTCRSCGEQDGHNSATCRRPVEAYTTAFYGASQRHQ
jgi:hypothetical protein